MASYFLYTSCSSSNGGAQVTKFVTLTDEWQEITLDIKPTWEYANLLFGWAANDSDLAPGEDTMEFWIDGIHYAR